MLLATKRVRKRLLGVNSARTEQTEGYTRWTVEEQSVSKNELPTIFTQVRKQNPYVNMRHVRPTFLPSLSLTASLSQMLPFQPAHFPFHTPLPLTSEEAEALLRPGPNSTYKARHSICQRGDLHGQKPGTNTHVFVRFTAMRDSRGLTQLQLPKKRLLSSIIC